MKFSIISYTLFLFLMIIIFPSLIYAPWTEDNPPIQPADDILMNCAEWINYNGFTLDDYETNRERAMSRDISKDRIASTWAAIYAFKISGLEDIYRIKPQDFCDTFGPGNLNQKKFKSLEVEKKNCKDWVKLYRFKENHNDNFTYAMNIDPINVEFMSIWAYSYWAFLIDNEGAYSLTPLELCRKMGKTGLMTMRFMSVNETLLSCMDWIDLYDYDYSIQYNFRKATALTDGLTMYYLRIHFFPDRYAFDLVMLSIFERPINHMTPIEFCRPYDGNGVQPQKYDFYFGRQ